jgi:23S rRNA-/tRNA-specific pseudouridylate synthase
MKPKHRHLNDQDLSHPLDEELAEISAESITTTSHDFAVDAPSVGQRLDQFLTTRLPSISRARVQQWIDQNCVLVRGHDGNPRATKASSKLRAG